MKLSAAVHELLSDETNFLSTGRLISVIGALIGAELVQVGVALIFIAIFKPDALAANIGISLIGIGGGFFTGGALFKFGSKAQEQGTSTEDVSAGSA